MAAVHKYRNDDGDLEVVDNVLRWGWSSQEQAEEGSAASIEVYVDDPLIEIEFVTWRRWVIYESTSEVSNEIIFSGFITSFSIAHTGQEIMNATGRVWTVRLADMNNLWDRRVMVGSDTDRPAETDVERMQWLVDSEEMGYFDDYTLLSTASPVNLDARDVRGTSTKQVADECAQDSGKNYWIGTTGTIGGIGTDNFIWYGKSNLTTYVSPLALSNDPGELDMADVDDGTATTYPLGADTVLERTGDRIYDGAYIEYDGGAVHVKKPSTTSFFQLSGRDISTPAPEIKTATRAKARGTRMLNDLDTMEDRITTSPEIPAGKATMIRAGMLINITATHLPGWDTGFACRILSAQHQPIYGGSWYRVTIVAEPVGEAVVVPPEPPTPDATSTACNDYPGNRSGGASTSLAVTPGATYTWRMTQTAHEFWCHTQQIIIRTTAMDYRYVDMNPVPSPGSGGSGPAVNEVGTFVVPASGDGSTGSFSWVATTDGYADPGFPPFIDDCWTLELWLGDVEDEL